MPTQGGHKPRKRKKYKARAPGKASREVFELVKSNWPVTPSEIMKLRHYSGNPKTGHARYLGNFKTLQRAGLIELKKSGRIYVAWPKDLEKLRDEELRNGLIDLREGVTRVIDNRIKESRKRSS
jgi:hypothetical protein